MLSAVDIIKMILKLVVLILFVGVIGLYAVVFADFEPPVNEPPCKAGSIVAYLDPCEVR